MTLKDMHEQAKIITSIEAKKYKKYEKGLNIFIICGSLFLLIFFSWKPFSNFLLLDNIFIFVLGVGFLDAINTIRGR